MIIEMRTYKLKPGVRARFLQIFRSKSMPRHAELGMKILGPFLSVEEPDTFFFMRGFPDLAAAWFGGSGMAGLRRLLRCGLLFFAAVVAGAAIGQTQSQSSARGLTARDGQHDFDFEMGKWKTHLSRLQHPLTGSTTWVDYDGTTTVRKIWNGRANLVELEVDGPAGHIEALALRLYNPESHQWSLNYSNSKGGTMSTPTIGEFNNGRGEFYDQESLNGRSILVRFVISDISANSCHFEQAYSDDGGKTWEVNWIATDTRIKGTLGRAQH